MRWTPAILALTWIGVLGAAAVAAAVLPAIQLNPGDEVTVRCSDPMTHTWASQHRTILLRCPGASATPSPTAAPTATPSPAPTPTATALATPTATVTASPSPSPTVTITPPPSPTPSATPVGNTLVLCDGNANAAPLKLDGGVAADPSVLKIIRDCTFDHIVGQHAIVLNAARNVLITGNVFTDIHSGQAGVGQHGIGIRGASTSDDIVIRGNSFCDIGADGIQMAYSGPNVESVLVEGNAFTYACGQRQGGWTGGENAVDVKGVKGPIVIRGNSVAGFLPCDPGDECSGSNGVGIVVHDGSGSGRAQQTTVEGNFFTGSVTGLNVTDSDDTTIRDNTFVDNLTYHVRVTSAAAGCTHSGDTFSGTGAVAWGPCVAE